MKNLLMRACYLIGILTMSCFSFWDKISLDYGEAVIKEMALVDSFHYALVLNSNNLYRRNISQRRWDNITSKLSNSFSAKEIKNIRNIGNKLYIEADNCCYYSEDYGNSWNKDLFTGTLQHVTSLGTTLFTMNRTGQNNSVEYRRNEDSDWTLSRVFDENISAIACGDSTIYIGGWGHVFISRDSGVSWLTLAQGLPERTAINYIYEHSSKTIFTSTEKGIYYTVNGGEEWQLFSDDFVKLRSTEVKELVSVTGNKNVLYTVTNSGALYELDIASKSVSPMAAPLASDERVFSLQGVGDTLWVGGEKDLYYYCSINEKWSFWGDCFPSVINIDTIYQNSQYDFLFIRSETNKASIFRKERMAHPSWEKIASFPRGVMNVIVTDSLLRLYSGELGEKDLFVSRDNGESWDTLMSVDEDFPVMYHGGFAVQKRELLFFSNGALAKSRDNGRTWDSLPSIRNVDEMFVVENRLCVTKGNSPLLEKLFWFSDDDGETFTAHPNVEMTKNLQHFRVCGLQVIGLKDGELFYSPNQGDTWEFTSTPFGDKVEEILFFNEEFIICQSVFDQSYFYTRNKGRDWFELNEFLGVSSLRFYDNGNHLLAIADDEFFIGYPEEDVGLLNSTSSAVSGIDVKMRGKKCALHFARKDIGQLEFTIFSLRGQRILSKNISPVSSKESVSVDLSGFASGKYLLLLSLREKEYYELLTIH